VPALSPVSAGTGLALGLSPPGAPPAAVGGTEHADDWRERLRSLLQTQAPTSRTARPTPRDERARSHIADFVGEVVVPAFEALRDELARYGREANIDRRWNQASLVVRREGREEFAYAIRGHAHQQATFAFPEHRPTRSAQVQFRAEAILRSGQRWERNVQDFDRDAVIRDFLDAYAKWMGW
jgi:hypothetical protein